MPSLAHQALSSSSTLASRSAYHLEYQAQLETVRQAAMTKVKERIAASLRLLPQLDLEQPELTRHRHRRRKEARARQEPAPRPRGERVIGEHDRADDGRGDQIVRHLDPERVQVIDCTLVDDAA